MKKKRTALFHSVISLLLCVSMLIGTTFAWFTDSVTTGINTIAAGNLDVELYHSNAAVTNERVDSNTKLFMDLQGDPILWEPGVVSYENLRITNEGDLALAYQLAINTANENYIVDPSGALYGLSHVLKVGVVEDGITATDRAGVVASVKDANWTTLANFLRSGKLLPEGAGETEKTWGVVVYWEPGDNDNFWNLNNGKHLNEGDVLQIDLGVKLVATQEVYESDSFGDDYDTDAKAFVFPDFVGGSASTPIEVNNQGQTVSDVTMISGKIKVFVPAGVQVKSGVTELSMSVSEMVSSGANVSLGENEDILSLDVHIEGIAENNTVPITVTLAEVAPAGLNMGNYKLFHVESAGTKEMTLVDSSAEFTAHNQFKYDPATGDIALYMASFSEVTVVADTYAKWEGSVDHSWYIGKEAPYTIANADQLWSFSQIVGGMAKDESGNYIYTATDSEGNEYHNDSFKGKTIKLIVDINLADDEKNNDDGKIFYPIGYYNSEGTYERTNTAISSGLRNFEGTFDGNGHTIANFYHNTWEMKGDHNWYSPVEQYYRDGMGLFGRVYGGTVKNLTVSNFSSDGEIATTGCIAAYADGATFENIAIINCNPRVYNIGNGGIVGCVGWYAKEADLKTTFKNITVDNSNKISALWGSYDVACGGIVGQYYPTSGQTSAGTPKNAGIDLVNCHVAAQMDVYNDVCGNYQYYAYRYAGMLIGSIRENVTGEDGRVYPKMDGITASGCTVHYDTWNDYFYCELVANSKASYTHDHQMSRLTEVKAVNGTTITYLDGTTGTVPTTGWANYVVVSGEYATENATCYHFVDGKVHNHNDYDGNGVEDKETVNGKEEYVEDKRHIYLPFSQLFTGYGWGVNSKGLSDYKGVETMDITYRDDTELIEKFKKNEALSDNYIYRVGNQNEFPVGKLFKEISEGIAVDSGVHVSVTPMLEGVSMEGTFVRMANWEDSTLRITGGTGLAKLTIQDYNNCEPFNLYVEVVDAYNATSANNIRSAQSYDVVLLGDITTSSEFTVSNRHTFYGNGFKVNCSGDGTYSKVVGMDRGYINVESGGVLDNVQIICNIYPAACLYPSEVKNYPDTNSTTEKYKYQLSAIALKGNGSKVINSYAYGARNNIYVGDGNVTIENTTFKNGALSNIQIKSSSASTVTLIDVTTVQELVTSNINNSKTMLGCGVLVGDPDAELTNPNLVIQGDWNHYNWVTAAYAEVISNDYADVIITTALSHDEYVHEKTDGTKTANLGIIFLNQLATNIRDQRAASIVENYKQKNVEITVPATIGSATIKGQVYSIANKKGNPDDNVSDYLPDTNVGVKPTAIKDETVGGNKDTNDGGEDTSYCYWDGDLLKLMYKENESAFTLDVANLVKFQKHGYTLDSTAVVTKDGVEVPAVDGKVSFTDAGTYVITYIIEDDINFDTNGKLIESPTKWTFAYEVESSVAKSNGKTAVITIDSNVPFTGSYGMTSSSDSTFLSDFHYCVPVMRGVTIQDYDENGNPEEAFNAANDIIGISVTGARTAGEIVINYLDGRKLTIVTGTLNQGIDKTSTAISLKQKDGELYLCSEGYSDAKGDTTWVIKSYTFVGNNGIPVSYTTQRSCSFTSSDGAIKWSNFSNPTVDAVKFTVAYDANGGSCTKQFSYATNGNPSVTLPTPTRSGYIFAGWYDAASGGNPVGGAGESYTPSANITLYAQWGKPCTVTYNANGGSCGTASAKYTGTALTLPTATRDGYWFVGWYKEDGSKVGDAGATYTPSDEITLYAHWQEKIEYTVTYNANGGTCGTASATYQGTALTLPTPTRTGYTFNGWYTAASGGTKAGAAGESYIPSANITLYAQWNQSTYTISVNTTYCTVTSAPSSAVYGASVSITVSYNADYEYSSVSVVGDETNTDITVTNSNSNKTFTFIMPAENVTVKIVGKSCVTGDTLITLADGTQVRVDSLKGDEQLLVWNMETGKLDSAPILFVDSEEECEYEIIHLYFSDGTDVKVISEHGFWDYDLNKYVYLDRYAEKYIGHTFARQNGSKLSKVTLTDVVLETEVTTAWSPVTAGHLCYFVNGMLSMPGGVGGLFNIFTVDPDTMTYDFEAMQRDIETYGLYTYEELNAICPLSEEMFNMAGGAYLKISIGKGNLTEEELIYMINRYSKFF